jgi:hypothetical protein
MKRQYGSHANRRQAAATGNAAPRPLDLSTSGGVEVIPKGVIAWTLNRSAGERVNTALRRRRGLPLYAAEMPPFMLMA